jgi:hypothetical protein
MKVTIEINMDNSAFEDQLELERILKELSENLDSHDIVASLKNDKDAEFSQGIFDSNGNRVGEILFTN